MTVKCTFCKDTKIEPGIPGPCVWCEQVGAAPVAVGYQLAKGFTDPVGDCEKFEAGITVNAWLQRIVVYGDSPADAEALRDHIMASAEREAALREELAKFKAGCVDLSSQVRELEHKMDYYKGEGMRADALQQRLTLAEQQAGELEGLLREVASLDPRGEFLGWQLDGKIDAALKPAAEQRATEMEMDKRRLDFLQENLVSINCRVRNTGFCGPRGREFAAYIYAAGPNDKKPGEGETLRQAIDSMMENNGDALKPAAEGEGS